MKKAIFCLALVVALLPLAAEAAPPVQVTPTPEGNYVCPSYNPRSHPAASRPGLPPLPMRPAFVPPPTATSTVGMVYLPPHTQLQTAACFIAEIVHRQITIVAGVGNPMVGSFKTSRLATVGELLRDFKDDALAPVKLMLVDTPDGGLGIVPMK
jgi:hypothetical protein